MFLGKGSWIFIALLIWLISKSLLTDNSFVEHLYSKSSSKQFSHAEALLGHYVVIIITKPLKPRHRVNNFPES